MTKLPLITRIQQYWDADFPILYLNTFEELNGLDILFRAAKGSGSRRKAVVWSFADGICLYEQGELKEKNYKKTEKIPLDKVLSGLLKKMLETGELAGKVLIFTDIHHYLDEVEVITVLKSFVNEINKGADFSIVFLSPIVIIPKELEKFITIIEMEYMDYNAIRQEIVNFINEQELPMVADQLLDEIAMAFKGLTKFEIQNLLALAYSDDGELTHSDLSLIYEQKKQMIMKSGILEMITVKEKISDIGGLENLKDWFAKKARVIKNINAAEQFGVSMPKGVLIAGVPGCGKSLSAKAAAALFELPLLRMDMGRLMGKYVGESEGNMRKAIALTEAIAPCVLWIDELEKAFAGINSGNGGSEVTTRLFGNFLTWMQEKESPVFVIATANNITDLPPELMRKGRFDEIFFVGLPKSEERKKIFEIHLSKRRPKDLVDINLQQLVNKTEGYSGADIEGVVKDAVEDVFASGKDKVTTDDVLRMIENTHSLSEIMKEPLEKMNKEYEERKFKNASR